MRSREYQNARAGGFTLLEILVTISILIVIAGLVVSIILPSRRAATRAKCIVRIRDAALMTQTYALSNHDAFPAFAAPGTKWYRFQPMALNFTWWSSISDLPHTTESLRCPADTPRRNREYDIQVDYFLSASCYLDASAMVPTSVSNVVRAQGRVNRWTDVAFPSQKTVLVEEYVWHAWDGNTTVGGPVNINLLMRDQTRGSVSLAFADGHAAAHPVRDGLPYVVVPNFVGCGVFSSTVSGVRGIDVR